MKKRTNNGFFINYIWNRLYKQNKNCLIVITGETGSGKSFSSLKLGELISDDFNINNVVFTAEAFTSLLKSGTLKEGSVVVWDEAGVGLNSRLFWSVLNQAIFFIMQTFRADNIVCILTTPDISFIDVGIRKLMHFKVEVQRIDYIKKQVITKLFRIKPNPRTGKIYHKYLKNKKLRNAKLSRYRLGLPSEQLVKDYEEKKKVFNIGIKDQMDRAVKSVSVFGKKKPTREETQIYKLSKRGGSQKDIAKEYNINPRKISRIIDKCGKYYLDDKTA